MSGIARARGDMTKPLHGCRTQRVPGEGTRLIGKAVKKRDEGAHVLPG